MVRSGPRRLGRYSEDWLETQHGRDGVTPHCALLFASPLIEHGGNYLDADVLVQRGFDDLLNYQTVLEQEGIDAQMGLANAVILAEPHSQFLLRWLEEYRSFRWGVAEPETWNAYSVKLPAQLARAYPWEITVLPHTAF